MKNKILIYGAGMIGKQLALRFREQDLHVVGFIDRRAHTINVLENNPVLSVEQSENIPNKEEYVIVIAIKNVFQHTQIVSQLRNIGFYFFVFKPITILQGCNTSKQLERINKIYEAVVENEGELLENPPSIQSECLFEVKDWAFIRESDDVVTAYIPSELLYTNYNPDNIEWSCKNFLATYTAVDMYSGFSGRNLQTNQKLVNEYIDKIALPGALKMELNVCGEWRKGVVEGRKSVYWEMKKKWALQPYFFVENSPLVRFEKGKFELISSGKNRISFLIEEGVGYIPVRIKKEEYSSFLNYEKVQEINDMINTENIKLFSPIPNPYFYFMESDFPGYVMGWLNKVGRILSRWNYMKGWANDFRNISIVDALDDQATSSRFFSNLGCNVTRIETDERKIDLLLDELLYSDYKRINSSSIENIYSDVCLINSNKGKEKIIDKIVKNCKHFCFIQMRDTEEWLHGFLRERGWGKRTLFFEDFYNSEIIHCYVYFRDDSNHKQKDLVI